jgi:hypothetical protein
LDHQIRVDGANPRESYNTIPPNITQTIRAQDPPSLPDTIRALDHRLSVQPGERDVEVWAKTDAGTATLQFTSLHVLSFPGQTATREAFAGGEVVVDVATTEPQPSASNMQGHGPWTKLLELQVPEVPDVAGSRVNFAEMGYVELLENTSGSTRGQIAIEILVPKTPPVAFELGFTDFQLPSGRGALYPFGDGLHLNPGIPAGATMRLWIRKVSGTGTFKVGRRYLLVKQVPAPACYFP